ncbi:MULTISPECIES: hypothetical protein [unclassified Haladaptatus]|uniref:hypothetical protein n=1 Tax=unclassified Haladaptatus TaxID=2622732 RepID=UPI00209C6698|nr:MULTISPECIES: hypothetical protein [unclassified Haladaptatus]MCO8244684.1 hypothetical protein [Haladaptatus sp. AB643]MCO8255803.1 hypothetical protein [Haladaptatus sp. AB618]
MMIGGLFLLGTVTTAPLYQYTNTRRQDFTISSMRLGVALLVLFTAAVHFYLFLDHGELIMALSGLGFLGGIGSFFIGVNRLYPYSVGILYTLFKSSSGSAKGLMSHCSGRGCPT